MTTYPPFHRESTPLGGRYHIVQPLGEGGFGRTFTAQDLHMPGHPLCVVKQLKPQVSSTEELQVARRLFDTEAQVLYQLSSHPQIPGLLAHFEENQDFYLAQELIQGHALTEELSGQPWSEEQVVAFLGDLLGVLAFVHSKGVIHRDIKPSNLIRRQDDNRMVLIDFGAVKQVSTQLHSQRSGLSHTISIGTQGYMPSEQLAGRPQFSSDLYAVGILGIQALTGYAPTDLHPHPHSGELDWRGYASQRYPDLLDLLDRLVRYDFRARYSHAAEALAALRQLPRNLSQYIPIEAVPIGSRPSSPGRSTQATPTVAVAPGHPSFLTAVTPLTHPAASHRSSGPSPSSKPAWVPILALMVLAATIGVLGAVGWQAVTAFSNPGNGGNAPVANTPNPEAATPTASPSSNDDGQLDSSTASNAVPRSSETANKTPSVAPPGNASSEAPPTNSASAPPDFSEASHTSPPLDPGVAQSTVVELYNHITNGNWENARAQFSPTLAEQFDPGFFEQFDQVTVENFRILEQGPDFVALLGENTYFYPDGTTQREERTFIVQRVDGQPRIVDSDFKRVIKFR
ncbi:MAG: protein kinase [Spirulina sp.]